MKRIGWVGYIEDKPDFVDAVDRYVEVDSPSIQVTNIFKRKKEAAKRFEDVREVFVKTNKEQQ